MASAPLSPPLHFLARLALIANRVTGALDDDEADFVANRLDFGALSAADLELLGLALSEAGRLLGSQAALERVDEEAA